MEATYSSPVKTFESNPRNRGRKHIQFRSHRIIRLLKFESKPRNRGRKLSEARGGEITYWGLKVIPETGDGNIFLFESDVQIRDMV